MTAEPEVGGGLDARRRAREIIPAERSENERGDIVDGKRTGRRRQHERRIRRDERERERGAYRAAIPALVLRAVIVTRGGVIVDRGSARPVPMLEVRRGVVRMRRRRGVDTGLVGASLLEQREQRTAGPAVADLERSAVGKRRRHEAGRHERPAQKADESQPK